MEKIFLILLFLLTTFAFAEPNGEVSDSNSKTKEFWPPDLIPHPHPPGEGPSGPGKPEMA